MQNITLGELTKLVVCCMVILAACILGCSRVIESDAVVGLIASSLGYVFGNGHGILSAKKQIDKK